MSCLSELHAEEIVFSPPPTQPEPTRADMEPESLAQARARYTVRWLHRQGLPATAALSPAEESALFDRAHTVAARFERRYNGTGELS